MKVPKSTKVSLLIIVAGIVVPAFILAVYHGFHLGPKLCTGQPSDVPNCSDGDMDGVIFFVVGIPLALFGIVTLVSSLLLNRFKANFNDRRFLTFVCALLAILTIWLLVVMFVPL